MQPVFEKRSPLGDTALLRTSPFDRRAMVLAHVLPQFHPIPENDTWWGRGFTDWTNVTKATPQFPGHYQPHLPGELGFYDLRLPEARQQQAELAAQHGIDGFMYYRYWFQGRQLLQRPVDEILASGQPDFPFCFCWANESWSRTWQSSDQDLMIEQRYSPEDDETHIRHLLPFFADRRYIRVDRRPLFIFYKPKSFPEPQRTFDHWREIAQREGVGELCLAQFESSGAGTAGDPRQVGLDLTMEFVPDWRNLGGQYYATSKARLAMALGLVPKGYGVHRVCDYGLMVERMLAKPWPDYPFVRGVTPGFDNTARRPKGATILHNGSPQAYGEWLTRILRQARDHSLPQHRIVLINAWNEWAEGNHLEPDARYGRAYLEATAKAIRASEEIA